MKIPSSRIQHNVAYIDSLFSLCLLYILLFTSLPTADLTYSVQFVFIQFTPLPLVHS